MIIGYASAGYSSESGLKIESANAMKPAQSNAQFVLQQQTDIDHVVTLLRQKYILQETAPVRIQRHYLDSFDWRLYQKGYVCGTDNHNSEHHFFICEKEADNNGYEFSLDKIPKFAQDIPHKACHKLLSNILDVRALITVAVLYIKRKQLLVLDRESKTLAILQAENYSIEEQRKHGRLSARLIIFPVKGYQKIFQDIVQLIAQHLKLAHANHALFEEVSAANDLNPALAQLSLAPKLTDSLSTWEAVQIVLTHLLGIMRANEPGIRDAIDTEFLHDYRVAIRRTRSILGQIKHVFPEKTLDYFKQEFYWLGTITGPVRDLDMYLLKFNAYMQELPSGLQNDLVPFRQFLQRHWQKEHARLNQALSSKRYHKLITEWERVLSNKNIQSHEIFNATKPAKQVAGQRIWKLYKKVIEQGMAINEDASDTDLHELRKTCKKFRYLIEFFYDYYSAEQIRKLIKALKRLQEHLGDFQDISIQIIQLNRFAQDMQNEGMAEARTIMAMGVLVEKLLIRKKTVREQFQEYFKEFTTSDKKTEFVNALRYSIKQKAF